MARPPHRPAAMPTASQQHAAMQQPCRQPAARHLRLVANLGLADPCVARPGCACRSGQGPGRGRDNCLEPKLARACVPGKQCPGRADDEQGRREARLNMVSVTGCLPLRGTLGMRPKLSRRRTASHEGHAGCDALPLGRAAAPSPIRLGLGLRCLRQASGLCQPPLLSMAAWQRAGWPLR